MFNMMRNMYVGIKHADKRFLNNVYEEELAVIKIQNNVKEAKINKVVR